LFIDSDPPGAVLTMDGRYVGTAPLTLTEVALGPHKVVTTAVGHEPNDVLVKIDRAGEKTNILVSLKPAAAPVEVADGGESPGDVNTAARARGRLRLATTPWAEVYLGNRKLGETPLVGTVLPAGKHTLRLYNPEKKLERTIMVEIKAGQTLSLKQKL
jgi:serine/threonine-protein kinase